MLRVSQTTTPTVTVSAESPAAQRLVLRRWRDPRLWMGLLLVASSVLVGARLLAASDDTIGVWAAARDVGTGALLSPDVLRVQQVRFDDPATAGRYLPASQRVPVDAVAARDVGAGELLARASIASRDGAAFELPVVVGPGGAPDDLRVGDVVDVWVGPQAASGGDAPARRMLTAVPVVGSANSAGPFGEAATRQVLLGLEGDAGERLGPLLGATASGSVVLVRHGASR